MLTCSRHGAWRKSALRLLTAFSPDHIQVSLFDQAEHAARSRYYSAGIAIQQAFREQMRNSKLQVWGREGSPIGPWRRVPAQAWAHVKFVGGDVIKLPGAPQPVTLYSVVVERPENAASALESTVAAEKRCQAWLVSLMAGGTRPESPKNSYRREALERFGVSARGFARAWAAAIAETQNTNWRRTGPRSSLKRRPNS
jgi:hypothetical protein